MDAERDERPVVYVIDDFDQVRRQLERLIESCNWEVAAFDSAEDFLRQYRDRDAEHAARPSCLVLDVRLTGMSGLSLLEHLRGDESAPPVLILTAHADVESAVRALRAHAFDFIEKPFSEQALLDRIRDAIEADSTNRARLARIGMIRERIDRLTPREKEVMGLVVDGKANKVIGVRLGLSQKTVEIHRGNVMRKMKARSLPDLVKMFVAVYGDRGGSEGEDDSGGDGGSAPRPALKEVGEPL